LLREPAGGRCTPAENIENEKGNFNIRINNEELVEVEGYIVENHKYAPEIKLFVHKNEDIIGVDKHHRWCWCITEFESGALLNHGQTKQHAIEEIDKLPYDKEVLLTGIAEFVDKYGKVNEWKGDSK